MGELRTYRIRRRRCTTATVEVQATDDQMAEFKAREGEGRPISYPRNDLQIEILSCTPKKDNLQIEKDLKE